MISNTWDIQLLMFSNLTNKIYNIQKIKVMISALNQIGKGWFIAHPKELEKLYYAVKGKIIMISNTWNIQLLMFANWPIKYTIFKKLK